MTGAPGDTRTDPAAMLRRNLKHQLRYPSLTLMPAGFPIVFLLLFVYVFGGQLGAGPGAAGPHPGRHAYLTCIVPGILIMTVAPAALGTAISIAMDMTQGMTDRFRTMAIARGAVLTGHVIGTLLQTLAVPALVAGVSAAMGFRPAAGPLAWLAAGVLMLVAFALIWLAAAPGLAAKSAGTASSTPMFLTLPPFLSGGFVLISTLPAGPRQLAGYQPFTPVIQTIRGLLTGGPAGARATAAAAWTAAIALACYLWPIRLYDRRRAARPKQPIPRRATGEPQTPVTLTRIPDRCPGPGAMPAANPR
jgi:ABC-2 type transport system permease protein